MRIDSTNPASRNAWYLCIEIFWAAIFTSSAAFNGVLAVRMGASNTDMGLLSSIPALLAIGISIPAGRFLQSRTRRKPWLLWSLGLIRAGSCCWPCSHLQKH